jgi:hypothetical protein
MIWIVALVKWRTRDRRSQHSSVWPPPLTPPSWRWRRGMNLVRFAPSGPICVLNFGGSEESVLGSFEAFVAELEQAVGPQRRLPGWARRSRAPVTDRDRSLCTAATRCCARSPRCRGSWARWQPSTRFARPRRYEAACSQPCFRLRTARPSQQPLHSATACSASRPRQRRRSRRRWRGSPTQLSSPSLPRTCRRQRAQNGAQLRLREGLTCARCGRFVPRLHMAATLGVGLFDALEAVRAERQAHLNHAVEVTAR